MTKNHGTLALAAMAAWSLLLDGCATLSHAVPGPEADQVARFEQQAEALRARLFIPGMSAVILKDEQVVWARGFGNADVEHRIPATPETVYHIASETKPVAATLVMQLVEQGRLDLDEPASHYTSEIEGDAIRIRHLLSHTAGSEPPGERFAYDPTHYEYLTNVIEKHAGKPMRLVVAETILDPLGMTSSVPGPDVLKDPQWAVLGQDRLARYAKVLERQAQPYTLYGDGEIVHVGYPGDFFGASAGLLSTVMDMARFDIALDRHVLLKPETQARAWTPFVSNAGQPLPYGLGWYVRDYGGARIIWHGGNWGVGFSAIWVKVPAERLSLIMFANSDVLNGHMYAAGEEDIVHNAFACAFLREFVSAPAQDVDCAQTSETAVAKSLAEERAGAHAVVPVDRATVESYVGQYRFEFDPSQVLNVTSHDGRLYANIPANQETELFPESPNTFFFKIRPAEITFVKDRDVVTHLEWVEYGNTLRANRIR
ncbi:MAG TPA: serine hydrolase [Longimicrobium sp.]|nr:serine hydrolase [Longimicrobium sp.]